MSVYHLAQLNVARAKAPLDSDLLSDFAEQLDIVNAAAEEAPGFIWRLKEEDGIPSGFEAFDEDNMLINLSVWSSVEALQQFLYTGIHLDVFKQKDKWFDQFESAHLVLWWVKAGERPTLGESLEKLSYLNVHGASLNSFDFKKIYPMPNS